MRRRSALGSRATAVAVGAVIGALIGATAAYAAFTKATTPVAASYASSHIFPTTTTVPAFDLEDASAGGAEAFAGSPVAFGDGNLYTALNNYPTAYSATKYTQFSMNSPLPGGIPVSSLQLNFGLRDGSTGTGQQACYYARSTRPAPTRCSPPTAARPARWAAPPPTRPPPPSTPR